MERHTDSSKSKEIFEKVHRKMSIDKVALFAKDCIFCNKEGMISIGKAGVKTTKSLLILSNNFSSFLLSAHCTMVFQTSDEDMTCLHRRHIFILNIGKSLYKILTTEEEKGSAHENTFLKVCELVSKEFIINQTVIKLTLYVK